MGKSKETINDRVRIVRKELGLTQQKFADKIKLKTGNTFSMIERGENVVTEQNILLLCTPNQLEEGVTVNADWLRTGQGDMFVPQTAADGRLMLYDDKKKELPQEERELVGIYRRLTRPNKTIARKQIDVLLESQGEPESGEEKGDMRKTG